MDWRLISAVTAASARFGVGAPGSYALLPAHAAPARAARHRSAYPS